MVFLQPHQGVVADELADFLATVIGAGRTPGSFGVPVVVEVDAALIVLAPAVKLPQIQITRAEVVVDDVQNHADPGLMGRLDEAFETGRTAVVGFHGENAGGVVSPGQVTGELGQRHHFDDVDAQLLQVAKLLSRLGELVGLPILLVVKRAQVHFIDHEFVDGRKMEVIACPVKVGRVDDRIPHRTGDFPRIGVNAQHLLVAVQNSVAIFATDACRGDVHVPVTFLFLRHRVCVGRPIVKRSRHIDRVGVRSPDPKGDARLVKNRTHSAVNFLRCDC